MYWTCRRCGLERDDRRGSNCNDVKGQGHDWVETEILEQEQAEIRWQNWLKTTDGQEWSKEDKRIDQLEKEGYEQWQKEESRIKQLSRDSDFRWWNENERIKQLEKESYERLDNEYIQGKKGLNETRLAKNYIHHKNLENFYDNTKGKSIFKVLIYIAVGLLLLGLFTSSKILAIFSFVIAGLVAIIKIYFFSSQYIHRILGNSGGKKVVKEREKIISSMNTKYQETKKAILARAESLRGENRKISHIETNAMREENNNVIKSIIRKAEYLRKENNQKYGVTRSTDSSLLGKVGYYQFW